VLTPAWNLSFSSAAFAGFMAVVLILYYLVLRRFQNVVLLAASYVFCAAWNPGFLLVLLGSSIVNHLVALRLEGHGHDRRLWLWSGVALNFAALFTFKYLGAATGTITGLTGLVGWHYAPPQLGILQPIGLSFYTLQALSYLIDVSNGQLPASRSFIETSLYLAYFPKLLAGPIERAGAFLEQIRQPQVLNNDRLAEAGSRILVGLMRKLVIADSIRSLVPRELLLEPRALTAPDLLFWWLVYGFVIYNDFAGYTSIARGVSGLFGIRLSANFEQPWFSKGYIDFWNRWHMTLSSWLRDYIYMPISRAMLRRNPNGRHLPNLILPPLATMLISGLWHGPQPHFLLWGLLNGAAQAAERVHRSRAVVTGKRLPRWRTLGSWAGTLLMLLLISVPFQLEVPETATYWSSLLNWGAPVALAILWIVRPLLAIALSLFLDFAPRLVRDDTAWLRRRPIWQSAALAAGVLLIFLATRQTTAAPFIYQEF
jgi:D-alanyl-lipoteichoic acid acyltransferase DltB (MBOAT superfamily)